eukprot:3090438-Alexandrium_andersonii.AAC.1
MSASLVGSEMCIRDSPSSFKQLQGASRSLPHLHTAASSFKQLQLPKQLQDCLLYTSDAADDM